MPGRIDAATCLRRRACPLVSRVARLAAAAAFVLLTAAQAAAQAEDGGVHGPAAAPRGGPTAVSATAPAHAETHAGPPSSSHLLWRALALAVGAGVAWGLYRLGRGAAPGDPQRHEPAGPPQGRIPKGEARRSFSEPRR